MIQGRDGNLYGTAQYGGPARGGSVFRVTTDGIFTLLHAFHYPDDEEGDGPQAALVEAADGSLYGTTTTGGACSLCGTIFRVTSDGEFQELYAFERGSDAGTPPIAPLIQGLDGNFYGTTLQIQGALFQMTADGALTVLHAFTGGWDGGNPAAALLQTADGVFYGTAASGGPAGTGTVYRLTPDGLFDVVYTFPGSEAGASPSALVEAADGAVYGTARAGGPFNKGTVFQLTTDGIPLSLHAFDGQNDGSAPSTLIEAAMARSMVWRRRVAPSRAAPSSSSRRPATSR